MSVKPERRSARFGPREEVEPDDRIDTPSVSIRVGHGQLDPPDPRLLPAANPAHPAYGDFSYLGPWDHRNSEALVDDAMGSDANDRLSHAEQADGVHAADD